MRNKAEIEAEIEKLKKEIFYLDMKDGWDHLDFEESHRLNKRLKELEKELTNGS